MGATLEQMQAQLESDPRFQALDDTQKNAERANLAAGFRNAQQNAASQRVQALAQQEQEAQQSGMLRSIGGMARSAALGLADQGTLGYGPKVVGALMGPQAQQSTEDQLAAARQVNPTSYTLGSLGSFFLPGSPARVVAEAGGLAAGKLIPIAGAAADAPFLQRAAQAFGRNLVSGAGGITGVNLASGDDRTLQQRISDSYDQIKNPVNVGLAAAPAIFSSALQKPPDPDLNGIFARWERVTGTPVPAEVANNSAALQKWMDAAARTPGFEGPTQKAQAAFVSGLKDVIADIGSTRGSAPLTEQSQATATSAVTALRGTTAQPGTPTQLRRGIMGSALAQTGTTQLPPQVQLGLQRSMEQILASRPSELDDVGSAWLDVVKKLRDKMASGDPMDVNDLEAIRKNTANAAWTANPLDPGDPRWQDRGRVEAKKFYDAIREAASATAPAYDQALEAAQQLRAIDTATGAVTVSDLDAQTMRSWWTAGSEKGQGPLARWKVAVDNFAPEDVAALRASYLMQFAEAALRGDKTISEAGVNRAIRSNPVFNKQVMDAVIPGARQDLMGLAQMADRYRQGRGSAEGSQTGSRVPRIGAIIGVPLLIGRLLTNPFGTVGKYLGEAGSLWAARQAYKSLLSGSLGQAISTAAQGRPAPPMSPVLPSAIAQSGVSTAPGIQTMLQGLQGGAPPQPSGQEPQAQETTQ